MKRTFLAAASLVLAACSAPVVPDMTYYRLPDPRIAADGKLSVSVPIDVAVFGADGLYAEQALIYTLDSGGRSLRSYHYQHWSDPPSRMLQRRLIEVLRQRDAAPVVTDRLPASANAVELSGVIQRYDRVQDGEAFHADVALQIRVERGGEVLAEKVYAARAPADGNAVEDTVKAFGVALDRIFSDLINDLAGMRALRE
ncbi:ABC-type transport auxiliary lipoprotein family protein [Tahibacter amnicola]|uniref:PqiC family protein n=1 Tax=Tahibacter amnicola TaxID=2976241 RepID=A0ABY6BHC8_9GAMM|nr:PqiC family protein [Tahibacter amnicola]UXI69255.1 PqiC family protein [Tahibacter amnicola]